MAFVYGDRVKETSLSGGIGPMTLGGATLGFVDFATGVGLGNECFYGILDTSGNGDWELGRGTLGAGVLTRDTVFTSSNANSIVTFDLGTSKLVYTTVPDTFYDGALDTAKHELEDHTVPPLSLLDALAHESVDHSAAPMNLLSALGHEAVDHTLAPFNLLDATAHESVDHTVGPLSLLDETTHGTTDHVGAPLFLLDTSTHNSMSHALVPDINHDAVTIPERTAGTSTALRSFSPDDVRAMATIFGGIVSGGLAAAYFPPSTFAWAAAATTISTGVLSFTPQVAIAFATFGHSAAGTAFPGGITSTSFGVATPTAASSHGSNLEAFSDGNDMVASYAIGAIAGFSSLGGQMKASWDIATINAVWDLGAPDITLTPSVAITGNLTLIVLGSV